MVFLKKMNKVLHMNRTHPIYLPDGKIACTECQKPCGKNLASHIKSKHFNVNLHQCSQCDQEFPLSTALKNHMIQVHTTERNFKCSKCDRFFKTSHAANAHERMSHFDGNGPPCPQCGKIFKANYLLKTRLETVHATNKFYCEECGKGFALERYLNDHIERVHQEIPMLTCPFEDCETKAKGERNLKIHIKRNHIKKVKKTKNFICAYCPKSFHTNNTKKRHEKTMHLNQRDLKCDQCEYSTNYPGHLKEHKEAFHEGKMWDCDYPNCAKSYNKKGTFHKPSGQYFGEVTSPFLSLFQLFP